MAAKLSETEKLLIQNNPYYEEKYLNSRVLPKINTSYSSKKTNQKSSNGASYKKGYAGSSSKSSSISKSAAQREAEKRAKEAEKLKKEREKAEKERLALVKKKKEGAHDILNKYDEIYKKSYEDTSEAYLNGVKAQKVLNEAMAQQGLYGSGYSQDRNRDLAIGIQNDTADIYNRRLDMESQLEGEGERKLREIPSEMMDKRYKPSKNIPKKYVDRIVEQLLKEELKKQAKAQKWADSSDWILFLCL